jgi:phospho-N-acetylmuramoyl-pentapeptide-transferase
MALFVFILIAGANSVNITDGLDGLAGGLLLFQYAAYGFITYSKGLFILSAFCFIIVGGLIAFLWFNIHPARIFMGDVGSLALGATLAVIALLTDTLFAFIVMSSLFIIETLSVIIQMGSKKLRNGKKIFRVAPFHHHLEAIGWKEETIVMRFWLIGMVLAVAGSIIAMI